MNSDPKEQAYKDALKHALDAVVAIDRQSTVVEWNTQAEQIFGWQRSEALGHSLAEMLIPERFRDAHMRGMERFFAANHRGILNQRIKLHALTKNGVEIPVELTVVDVPSGGGTIFFAFLRDISVQEALEASRDLAVKKSDGLYRQAQDAISARDTFMSVAAHELNTPLTSLKLQAQIFERRRKRGEPIDVNKLVKNIDDQVNRLTRLVESMLDIARVAQGQLSLTLEPVNLGELVTEVVERLDANILVAECTCSVHLQPLVVGQWDRHRIEQVINNLLTNAIKYAAKTDIEIEVTQEAGSACLRVRDHGMGIPVEKQGLIFEQFERAVPYRSISGLGLGLYITRQVLRAHGGDVHVESSVGEGSTFTVTLPLLTPTSP